MQDFGEITNDQIDYSEYDGIDELNEEMEKIKVLVVATHILEMTRVLNRSQKSVLEKYCDSIIRQKCGEMEKPMVDNILAIYKKNID